jgi:hypothetical protein
MQVLIGAAIGCGLGFMFGVGCALAVFYAIYLGGYRKAVSDSLIDPWPENYAKARTKAAQTSELPVGS